MVRWWLDKGIDGFRLDAVSHMKKVPGLPDLPNPKGLDYVPSFDMHMNIDGVLDYMDSLCRDSFQHYDIMTVGEANGVSAEQARDWVGAEQSWRRAIEGGSGNARDYALENLGRLLLDRGDPEAAEAIFRQALAALERTQPDSEGLAGTLLELGGVAQLRGRLAEALALFRRAVDICGRKVPDGTEHAVAWADGWAPMDVALGDVAKKVGLFRRAAADAGRGDVPITIVTFGDPDPDALRAYRDLGVHRAILGAARTGWDDPATTTPFLDRYAALLPDL